MKQGEKVAPHLPGLLHGLWVDLLQALQGAETVYRRGPPDFNLYCTSLLYNTLVLVLDSGVQLAGRPDGWKAGRLRPFNSSSISPAQSQTRPRQGPGPGGQQVCLDFEWWDGMVC